MNVDGLPVDSRRPDRSEPRLIGSGSLPDAGQQNP